MNVDEHLPNLLYGDESVEAVIARRDKIVRSYVLEKDPSYKWNLNDFKFVKLIGGGRFGIVHRAILGDTQEMVALKSINLSINGNLHEARREVEAYKILRHNNILKLLACFEEGGSVHFALELMDGGDLRKLLFSRTHRTFSESLTADFIKQIAQGVNYCHSVNIMHRDLKPDNVLISCCGTIKIGDFGKSIRLPTTQALTPCGTPEYMAPEIIRGNSYNHKVDNWSIGVMLYEFLAGITPFTEVDTPAIFKRILNRDLKFTKLVSNASRELISDLLKMDSAERMSLEKVISHPWIAMAISQKDD